MMAGEGLTMQPQQPQVSALDELAKLETLRDQCVVTEQEFQEHKKKLLRTETVNQPRFDPQTGCRL
ncbi:MAG: SHOCT domain-containing protein [Halobacteriota archaeon]